MVHVVRRLMVLIVLSAISICAAQPVVPLEWERGYRTKHVIATRYTNTFSVGLQIGFRFPLNPHDSDRAEIYRYIADHGGYVFEGGCYPGAEMLSTFKNVRDTSTANKKLLEMLPGLEEVMVAISDNQPVPGYPAPVK